MRKRTMPMPAKRRSRRPENFLLGRSSAKQGIHLFLKSFQPLHEAVGLQLNKGNINGMGESAEFSFRPATETAAMVWAVALK